MGFVYFVLSNTSAAFISAAVAWTALRDREPWRRALAAVAGFPVVVVLVLLVLGTLGMLTPAWATATTVALAGAVGAVCWRLSRGPGGRDDTPAGDPDEPLESLKLGIPLVFLAAMFCELAIRVVANGVRYTLDDVWYHAVVPAHWLVQGRITVAAFDYHVFFPLNSELLALWNMLPFHSDGLATLAGLYWAVLLVVAVFGLCRALGGARSTALLAAALALSSQEVGFSALSFSASDLAGPVLLVAALAFAARSAGKTSHAARLVDAAYCGLMAGLAVGCKVVFAPPAVLLLLWLALSRRRELRLGRRARLALCFAGCAALAGGYWYVRNLIVTGNPVFPAELGPFRGPFARAAQKRLRLVHWLAQAPSDLGRWWSLLKMYSRWPEWLFALMAAGYLGALAAWRRLWPAGRRELRARALVALIGIQMLALYPFTPFSGTVARSTGELMTPKRYVFTPALLGIVLFSLLLHRDRERRHGWYVLGVLVLATSWQGISGVFGVAVVGVGALALAVWGLLRRAGAPLVLCRRCVLGAVPLVFAAFSLLAPYAQRASDRRLFACGFRGLGPAWQAVSQLPQGTRVGFFAAGGDLCYPLFGRRLELVPVGLEPDGTIQRPLLDRWRQGSLEPEWRWARTTRTPPTPHQLANLMAALAESRVDAVLLAKAGGQSLAADGWPPQKAVIDQAPNVERLYSDPDTIVWKLEHTPP